MLKASYGDLLPGKIEEARRRIQQESDEMKRRYGDDFDIEQCWYCGGRGELPGDRGFCDHCERGIRLTKAKDEQDRWALAIPARFRSYRFSTHPHRKKVGLVQEWIEKGVETGMNLFLGGPVGTGKTGMAIGALWVAHENGKSIHYTTVPDMLESLRPGSPDQDRNDATLRDLQTVGLLLLDDLGAEKPTEWTSQQLYSVINGRYHNGIATIVTSNMSPDVLKEPTRVGERTISRLMERASLVWLDGQDLRRTPRREL